MNRTFATIMLFSFLQNFLSAEPLQVGSPAPKIQAVNESGELIDLGKIISTGTTLVFFYPKAMTPGCTKQACSLRDGWEQLSAQDLKVFGVSSDSPKAQALFKSKYKLPYNLIADEEGAVSEAFGRSRWSRQAYLFKEGVLVWRDLKAATARQAEEVLQALGTN